MVRLPQSITGDRDKYTGKSSVLAVFYFYFMIVLWESYNEKLKRISLVHPSFFPYSIVWMPNVIAVMRITEVTEAVYA